MWQTNVACATRVSQFVTAPCAPTVPLLPPTRVRQDLFNRIPLCTTLFVVLGGVLHAQMTIIARKPQECSASPEGRNVSRGPPRGCTRASQIYQIAHTTPCGYPTSASSKERMRRRVPFALLGGLMILPNSCAEAPKRPPTFSKGWNPPRSFYCFGDV